MAMLTMKKATTTKTMMKMKNMTMKQWWREQKWVKDDYGNDVFINGDYDDDKYARFWKKYNLYIKTQLYENLIIEK